MPTATDELLAGKKSARLEAAITAGLDAAITERAKELAGRDGNPKFFRSAAARDLLAAGVLAHRKMKAKA